ncbi:hypothetical protein ACVNP1_07035 [Staphylococcus aureus]
MLLVCIINYSDCAKGVYKRSNINDYYLMKQVNERIQLRN